MEQPKTVPNKVQYSDGTLDKIVEAILLKVAEKVPVRSSRHCQFVLTMKDGRVARIKSNMLRDILVKGNPAWGEVSLSLIYQGIRNAAESTGSFTISVIKSDGSKPKWVKP